MDEAIEFIVGGKYENVKGVYQVISITGDSMVIRWENGEEISSSIELQQRIIENMRSREQRTQDENSPKPVNKTSKVSGDPFTGLKHSDFKNNVVKTKWRNRNALGGAVARQIYSRDYTFQSWAVYRMPVVQWADVKHRKKTDANKQAKFHVQLHENHMQYGFHVERSNDSNDKQEDWNYFLLWLKDNENWLNKISQENDLSVTIIESSGENRVSEIIIQPDKGDWTGVGKETIPSLASHIRELNISSSIEFYLIRRKSKEEAIPKGAKISEDIAAIFQTLMPLYVASTVHLSR